MTRLPHIKYSFYPTHTKQNLTSFEASRKGIKRAFFFVFPLCTVLKINTLWLFHTFGLCFLKPNKSPCQDAFYVIFQVCKRFITAEFLHHSPITLETITMCHQHLYLSQLLYLIPQTTSGPHSASESFSSSSYPVFSFPFLFL